MVTVNRLIGILIDGLLWPFRDLPDWVGLAFVSLLTAVGVLLVYRAASDQEGIAAVRRAIVGAILEMRLFRDDLVVVFRAQGRVLRYSFRYFRYSLVPLAWVLLPLALLVAQLQHVYGYRPLEVGDRTVVKALLPEDVDPTLEVSTGLRVESPGLRIPSLGEVDWRIAATERGRHTLEVRVGERGVTKTVQVGVGGGRVSPTRPSRGFIDTLLHPAEDPVPRDAPVHSISIAYPEASVSLLGWEMHWVVAFLLLTIVFGFALQRPLGVKL